MTSLSLKSRDNRITPEARNYGTDRGFNSEWNFVGFPTPTHPQLFIPRWPAVRMTVTPESIVTYPEHSVDVILEFPTVQCEGGEEKYPEDLNLPEFWIELFYCGHDVFCAATSTSLSGKPNSLHNSTTPTLYAELVRGFPRHRLIQLRCELFGLAGNYAVKLRAANSSSTFIGQTAFIKVCGTG